MFVHHEGGAARGVPADKARVLREIELGVLPKGYIAIDYNLMVFNDGDIWEGRGLANEDGATIHNNPTSVSICAVGNYEREAAPDALIDGIARAVQYAAQTGATVGHPNIRPHRAVFATACPGANLNARMDDIRARAAGAPTEEDDLDPKHAKMIEEIHDRVGWLADIEIPGGFAQRGKATPRTQALLDLVQKLGAKVDTVVSVAKAIKAKVGA